MKGDEWNNKINTMAYSTPYRTKTKKSHKVITLLILLILTFFVYLGVAQIIEENKAITVVGAVNVDTNNLEIENKIESEEIATKENSYRIELSDEIKANINGIYSSSEKRAFLTFDDGPSTNTLQILETLEKYDITATFFVLRITS